MRKSNCKKLFSSYIYISLWDQGLRWYAKRLRIDEDGDVADEFFDELLPEVSSDRDNQRPLPSFKVKYNTHPALVKNQVLTIDGGIRQNVEFQGRLQWV